MSEVIQSNNRKSCIKIHPMKKDFYSKGEGYEWIRMNKYFEEILKRQKQDPSLAFLNHNGDPLTVYLDIGRAVQSEIKKIQSQLLDKVERDAGVASPYLRYYGRV